jgi:hypothetical protein
MPMTMESILAAHDAVKRVSGIAPDIALTTPALYEEYESLCQEERFYCGDLMIDGKHYRVNYAHDGIRLPVVVVGTAGVVICDPTCPPGTFNWITSSVVSDDALDHLLRLIGVLVE